MLVHAIVTHSRVNGPGVRAVVYFQGCNLNCSGCWNTATHAFAGPARSVESVAVEVLFYDGIEGVTLSGGEPMQQAEDLLALILFLKCRRPEMSIGMYSGYTERELDRGQYWTVHTADQQGRGQLWSEVQQHLDFAVLGRYVAARPAYLPLRTSANQTLRFFNDRYSGSDFPAQECEVQIAPDGLVQVTGFPLAGSPS